VVLGPQIQSGAPLGAVAPVPASPHRRVIKVSDGEPELRAIKGPHPDPEYQMPARVIEVARKLDHYERGPVPLVWGEAKEVCDKLA